MRHAYSNADTYSASYGYTYSSGYCYTDSQPDVHAGTDNNTFRLE